MEAIPMLCLGWKWYRCDDHFDQFEKNNDLKIAESMRIIFWSGLQKGPV